MISKQIKDQIESNKVVVYSKTYCPYCIRAKDALKKLTNNIVIVELDELDDGSEIQSYLAQLTGQRTVPNIFINNKHIGGCDDLMAKIRKNEIQNSLIL
ncbi:hypothetical protein BB559_006108 [Furculomyces boomerangus]|uniref:Glutaredoxin domain-containing protein n=1 Tax=Furculomyces boomerangus TaxID=61424 RepID=A0A2T9Y4N5_9FUNG|nr:hypothetical protein BB559_006108 [Furculomyces boomerangus]